MSRPYALAIFDLDGTLVDSFPWFLTHLNGIADRFGFRRVGADEIEPLRSSGAREILKRLEVPHWKLPLIARHVRRLKAADVGTIPLYKGVDTMLQALTERGVGVAMVSSDDERNVRHALGPENARRISHYDCGASLFGKAARFKRVLRAAGIPAAETIAIGDELRDLEAARNAGIAFGAVSWGYASAEALKAAAPDELFLAMEDISRRLA
jgi:phosphoglycolate phosphatase